MGLDDETTDEILDKLNWPIFPPESILAANAHIPGLLLHIKLTAQTPIVLLELRHILLPLQRHTRALLFVSDLDKSNEPPVAISTAPVSPAHSQHSSHKSSR